MEDEKPNYYAIIPAEIRYDNELSSSEKLFYGEITALTGKTGECWANNKYFSDLYNVTPKSVSLWLNHLQEKEYINIKYIYKPGTKEIEKRIIGMEKNFHRYGKKFPGGMEKNVKDNNININNNNKYIKEYEKEIGLLTPYQFEILSSYLEDISEEMIIEAIHRASRMNKKSLSYVEGILKNWINNGYKVLGDIKDNKEVSTSIDMTQLNNLYEN